MKDDSLEQMLGLERKVADSAYIKEKLVPRSTETEADVLVLALAFIRRMGTNNATLAHRHGLRETTLSTINAGGQLQRNRRLYLKAFIRELNNTRLRAIKNDKEQLQKEVEWALAQVALLQNGIATDAIMVMENMFDMDAMWRRSAKARGML